MLVPVEMILALSISVLRPGSDACESSRRESPDTRASVKVGRMGPSRDLDRPLLTSPMVQTILVRVVKISMALDLVRMPYVSWSKKMRYMSGSMMGAT